MATAKLDWAIALLGGWSNNGIVETTNPWYNSWCLIHNSKVFVLKFLLPYKAPTHALRLG